MGGDAPVAADAGTGQLTVAEEAADGGGVDAKVAGGFLRGEQGVPGQRVLRRGSTWRAGVLRWP